MKAAAKINLFLKILGKRSDGMHELASRFVRLDEYYDEVFIIDAALAKRLDGLTLQEVKQELNSANIANEQSASKLLCPFIPQPPGMVTANILSSHVRMFDAIVSNFYSPTDICKKILQICNIDEYKFKKDFRILLLKNLPTFAGLGSASSDAASLCVLLEQLGLISNIKNLASKIGADVAFFASGAKNANVRGFGDEIEPLNNEEISINLRFGLASQTAAVFKEFAKMPKYCKDASHLLSASNEQILSYSPAYLNDLLEPMLRIYPQAQEFASLGMFLSGSGGSFFEKL